MENICQPNQSKVYPEYVPYLNYTQKQPLEDYPEEIKQQINAISVLYEKFTEPFPIKDAKEISRKEREEQQILQLNKLTYGEIDFFSFAECFLMLNKHGGLQAGGIFMDLGHGSGKALLSASLLHNFESIYGIEILEGLTNLSIKQKEFYESNFEEIVGSQNQNIKKINWQIFHSDFLEVEWPMCSLIFANSTCFEKHLIQLLCEKAKNQKIGTFFITLTKNLVDPMWQVLESDKKKMSWGDATVYIHKKIQ